MSSDVTPCSIASIIAFSQTGHAMSASTAFCIWNALICFGSHASCVTRNYSESTAENVSVCPDNRHRSVYASTFTASTPCFRCGRAQHQQASVVFKLEIWRKGKSPQAEAKALLRSVADEPVTPLRFEQYHLRDVKIQRQDQVRFVKV